MAALSPCAAPKEGQGIKMRGWQVKGAAAVLLLFVFLVSLAVESRNAVAEETDEENEITFVRELAGNFVEPHQVPPSTEVTVTVTANIPGELENARLIDYFPKDWGIADANGGVVSAYDETFNKIEWSIENASGAVSKSYVATSPEETGKEYCFRSELIYDQSSATSGDWAVHVLSKSAKNKERSSAAAGGAKAKFNGIASGDVCVADFQSSKAVKRVKIVPRTGLDSLEVSVEPLSENEVPPIPNAEVYAYMNITASVSGELLAAAVVEFDVPREWAKETDGKRVVLFHYGGKGWEELPTYQVGADGDMVHFFAQVTGFSPFGIAKIPSQTAIKTVIYSWNTRQGTSQSSLAAGSTYSFSPTKNIYIPDLVAFRKVFVVFHVQTGASAAANVSNIDVAMNMNGTDRSPDADPVTGQYTVNSGESVFVWVVADFTSAFQTYWTNGVACFPKITVAGATTEMHTAELFITYEYNENAPIQLKTVKYFVGSTGNVAANGTVSWDHTIEIPESGVTIRDKWYEIRGHSDLTAATDTSIKMRIGSDTDTTPSWIDAALRSDGLMWVISAPTASWNYNTTQRITITTSGCAINALSCVAYVTYEYDPYSPTQIKTVTYALGHANVNGSTSIFTIGNAIYLPDLPSADNIVSAYFEIFHSIGNGDSTTSVYASIGTNSQASVSYTTNLGGETCEAFDYLHDISSFMKQYWTNGATVNLNIQSSAASRLYEVSALLHVTYKFNPKAPSRLKTVTFPAGQKLAYNTGDPWTTGVLTFYAPEPNKVKRSVGLMAFWIGAATASETRQTRIQDGGAWGSAVSMSTGSSGEALTSITVNKDPDGKIASDLSDLTYNFEYDYGTTAAAVCGIIFFTYQYTPPPGSPVLSSPENNSTVGPTPTFEWETGWWAENHRIEVATDINFTNVVDNVTVVGDNKWTKPSPGYGPGTYYWRVWAVNAAGENVSENVWQFTCVSTVVDITLSNVPIEFGTVSPGTESPAITDAGFPLRITVESTTTVNVDIYIKGTDWTFGSYTVGVENCRYDNDDNLANGGWRTLTAVYDTPFYENVPPGSTVEVYFWISIPTGQWSGTYTNNIYVKAVKTGTSP